ncbi:polyprenyl synthetase family protein [Patescibacteria group bacterium]|nr:polyprenyl synthetase family protein [Patescibacteria group bacterium]
MTESFDPREPKSFINLPIEQKPQPTRVEGDSIDNSAIENPMEAQKEVVNFKKKLEMHISKELSSALSFCDKDLYTSVESLINTGGKFRALLFYDTARCFGYANEENLLTISSALEIIHRASLIHDDLVDQSSVRGQDKTLHVLYGNVPAVYVPNLLRDHVEKMLSNDPSIQKYLMQTYTQICEGQILESQISRSGKTRWEDYEKIVELKSAGLGEFALNVAYYLTHDHFTTNGRSKYIAKIGAMLFQIIDDLEDLLDTEQDISTDIQNNIKPAPWFFLTLEEQRGLSSSVDIQKALSQPDILQRTYEAATNYLGELEKQFQEWLPDNSYRTITLEAIRSRFNERTQKYLKTLE